MAKIVGDRKNKHKLRWRNVPLWFIKPLIEVGHKGEEKYTTFNFLDGQYVNDCLDSLKRHTEKLENPFVSDFDEETGLLHAAHMAWNSLMICYVLKYRPDLDDRWKPKGKKK